MNTRTLIVGAAPTPGAKEFYRSIVRLSPVVIAADGGADLCRSVGRLPDACVGDLDSVSSSTLDWLSSAGVAVHRYPADKSESDLDLAVGLARGMGTHAIDITAAFHGRIDHTLAAFGTLLHAADRAARGREPAFTAYALDARTAPVLSLSEPAGTVISLFTLEPGTVATMTGVRYPLLEGEVPPLVSRGLSNVAKGPTQRIELTRGTAFLIVGNATTWQERTVFQAE